jgi:methanesulfonate monooxygenase large subunit
MARTRSQWESAPPVPQDDFVSSAIYTDETVFREELDLIRRKCWKFVCHVSEIPNIHDFRTADHCGTPLIIARGEDDKIRTFLNACSHRSSLIALEPSGNARQLTCVFHRWVFDTKGNCVAIPREEGYDGSGICKESMGLREIRTAVRLGMVFVNLDDDCEPFEDFAGNALDLVEDVMGSEIELEVFHIHRSVATANWKQWQETQMEPYHEYLHYLNRLASMSAEGYKTRAWRIYPNGHGALEPLKHRYDRLKGFGERTQKTLPGLGPNEARIVNLFPDTSIHCRATTMRIDTTIAVSPTQTIVERRGLGIKGESAEDRAMRRNDHNQFWGPFGRNHPEDVLAIEYVEAANRSGAAPAGIFARHEGNMGQDDVLARTFYREWEKRMGRLASDPSRKPAQAAGDHGR